MKNNLLVFSLILMLATACFPSCKSSEGTTPKGTPVGFTEIKTGNNSSYSQFETLTINKHEELISAWSNFFMKYDRKPPIPSIDFESKTLIAVALGERNNGGYAIKIKSISETNTSISVVTEEVKPGSTCNSTTSMVYPFQLVEILKTDKSITFTKTVKVNECGKNF